ncbi:DM13 domain-containing protein [Streptomyces sp. NPDC057193]|uniref:DM13 domain-containing protein n=1 Tax=Streptomyces sp. NPDC057193 TaxID=3346043 RepID=UPI0036368E54
MERVRRKRLWAGLGIAVTIAVVAGLVWFKPWALWVDETVNEALPAPGAPADVPVASPTTDTSSSVAESPSGPAGPVTLAQGTFISHEHSTAGSVKVVRLADGSHTLRLEGLDTSNGPDLRVWLSDAPVKEGKAGWGVFDDGRYVNLAKLKGNKGDQNYPLPPDIDWSTFPSVSIWCDRFDVSFGAAALVRV